MFSINSSTWTIDLCFILNRFNIKHKYFTMTIGINPDYATHSYYDKILATDTSRINEKFSKSKELGIDVVKQTLPISNGFLMEHLAHCGPIILLTNAALLTCDICKYNKLPNDIRFDLKKTNNYIN